MRSSAGASHAAEVVIVGGGVIGLSLAWRLRQRGASVIVVERGVLPSQRAGAAPDGQAAWAAAGMLAPLAETTSHTPLLDLGLASIALYPGFVEELAASTTTNIAIQGPGMLRLAQTPEQADALETAFQWQRSLGVPLEWIDAASVRRLEPALEPNICAAVYSPLEKHVDPRTLLCALEQVCLRSGVEILSECPVVAFETTSWHVTGLETIRGKIACGELVLAAGSWTAELARKLDILVPVKPIRGQMIALACPQLLGHTVYTHDGYLVPRDDGRLLVGATEEDAGFESRPTVQGLSGLFALAGSLLAGAGSLPFHSAWAGLRPASPDHLPIMGAAPGWENAHLATGHFRNGILLTPLTAQMMAAWVSDRELHPLFEGVTPGRFSPRHRAEVE